MAQSLFSAFRAPQRAPQRAPHTDLPLPTGLTLSVDTASLPRAVQARGQGESPTPTSAAHPSHPITLQVLPLLSPVSSGILSCLPLPPISFRSPSTPTWIIAIAPDCPPSCLIPFLLCSQGGLKTEHIQSCHMTSHDTDFQRLLAALGMKAGASAQDLAPCTSLTSSLTFPHLPWNLGHPKNDFHFLDGSRRDLCLGLSAMACPLQGTFLPDSPHLSSSFKAQQENYFFQEGFSCHCHPIQHTHSPKSGLRASL